MTSEREGEPRRARSFVMLLKKTDQSAGPMSFITLSGLGVGLPWSQNPICRVTNISTGCRFAPTSIPGTRRVPPRWRYDLETAIDKTTCISMFLVYAVSGAHRRSKGAGHCFLGGSFC